MAQPARKGRVLLGILLALLLAAGWVAIRHLDRDRLLIAPQIIGGTARTSSVKSTPMLLPAARPGTLVRGPAAYCGPPVSRVVQSKSQWRAGDREQYAYTGVIVCAGAFSNNSKDGAVEIVRNEAPSLKQAFIPILVPGSGPLTIVRAPLGVDGSLHARDADLFLRGSHGQGAVLHLATDSVTLMP